MINGLESSYQQIADSIQSSIKDEWIRARMDAIFYERHISFFGEYVEMRGGQLKSFPTGDAAEEAFMAIRDEFREAKQPLWGQAAFEIQSDGTFRMNWGYENCDEQGNTRFDEDEYIRFAEERMKRFAPG